MDKEKQIEEMAKIIRPVLTDRIHIAFIPALDKPIAQELYEQNYRKINENEVVISKGEYIELKEQLKELEEQRDEQAYITEDLIQEKHLWTEQARKEMTEKIFDILYQWLDLEEIEKYGFVTIQKFDFLRKFREIYKQFGVDLGDNNE